MMGLNGLSSMIGDLLRNNMAEGPFKDLLIDWNYWWGRSGYCLFAEYLDFVFLHFSYGRFGLYGSCSFYHG